MMPDGTTAAVWFVKNVLYDHFRALAKLNKVSIDKFHDAILNLAAREVVPSTKESANVSSAIGSTCPHCPTKLRAGCRPCPKLTCSLMMHKSCMSKHVCSGTLATPSPPNMEEPSVASLSRNDTPVGRTTTSVSRKRTSADAEISFSEEDVILLAPTPINLPLNISHSPTQPLLPVDGLSKSGKRRYWKQVSQYRRLCCNLPPFPKPPATKTHSTRGTFTASPHPQGLLTGPLSRPSLLGPPPLLITPPTPPPSTFLPRSSLSNIPRQQNMTQLGTPAAKRRRPRSRPPGASGGRVGGPAPSSATPFQSAGVKWGGPGRNTRCSSAPHAPPPEPGPAFLAARAHWRVDHATATGPQVVAAASTAQLEAASTAQLEAASLALGSSEGTPKQPVLN